MKKVYLFIFTTVSSFALRSQVLPSTYVGFGNSVNTLTGTPGFRYNEVVTNDSAILNIGDLNQWTGSTSLGGVSPAYNFSRLFNGRNYLSVENQSNGNDAAATIFVQGAPGSVCGGLASNARYFQAAVFSPNYTIVPEFAGKTLLSSGGGNMGFDIYSDNGTIKLCTNRIGGYIYNPDLTIYGYTNCAIGPKTGFIGINTDEPRTRLDVDGLLTLRQNTVVNRSFIPFIDVDGVVQTNTNVLISNNGNGLESTCAFTTTGGQCIVEVATGDYTGSSMIMTGRYNADRYGQMRTFEPGYASNYPFMASSTVFWNRGGQLSVGTYDNFPVSFFTNAIERFKLSNTTASYSVDVSTNKSLSSKGITLGYSYTTENFVPWENEYTIDCNGTLTVHLLSVTYLPVGKIYVIKNSGTGTVTIDPDGGEYIDGSQTYYLSSQYSSIKVQSTGSKWIIIN